MPSAQPLQPLGFAFAAMGSPCEIRVFARDPVHGTRVFDAARAEVERLEQRYSRYRSDSLLADINRVAARGGGIDVDAETASLLDYADTCYRQSDGLFDITSGLLRAVWRFDGRRAPEASEVASLLARIGWDKLERRGSRLHFPPGMELDFGGIVKEYAADRVAALCQQHGVQHGFVNLGGDIRIVGPQPDGRSWQIGIQHPRRAQETALGNLPLHSGALATSGDYARCMVIDGVRYGHILNPKTGWPVRHLASVTVVSDFCVVAGSASTIAMLKEADGPGWLAALGVPHLWIDTEGRSGGSLASELQAI